MSTRKFLAFGKVLVLLLLISCSVHAKAAIDTKFSTKEIETFNKAESSLHKNMLQTQVVHVTVMHEQPSKPVKGVSGDFPFCDNTYLLLQLPGQTNIVLQDADRCESVSRLLFPFHNFW